LLGDVPGTDLLGRESGAETEREEQRDHRDDVGEREPLAA
jgi:hypothetical protein